jgi:hypothetical protein
MANNNSNKDCTTCANLHTVDGKYKACIMGSYFSYLIDYPLTTTGCAGWKPKKPTEQEAVKK